MQLKDKKVIVTGAGSGIGEAIAATFATEGAEVVTLGRTLSKLEQAQERAGDGGARLHPQSCDISDKDDVAKALEFAQQQLGRIDILVNNAGSNVPKRALKVLSIEDWEYMVDINLNGAFYLVHGVLPQMRERGNGLIINVSSTAGVRATPLGGAGYSSSKYGMTALSLSIGQEEGENGVRSCLICPGEVNTPILDNRPVVPSPERRAKMLQPEDLASAALLCATLHPRATIPMMVITPATQHFA